MADQACWGMCSGSKTELVPSSIIMEGELHEPKAGAALCKCSVLLELAASDDLVAFKSEVEEKGLDLGEASFWYGRRIGSRKMGFEERTPLTIAAMFGSVDVLKYIIGSGKIDVNRACGTDGVTALHCAVAGGANSSAKIVKLLLDASADANCVDANGNKPVDLIVPALKSLSTSRRKVIELLLKGDNIVGVSDHVLNPEEEESEQIVLPQLLKEGPEKKEYPVDVSLPDINNGVYGTDEFRMYTFKVKPCSRAYSHDWTECPFVHPGENARRRDPRKYPYSCVPCPEFRKGACPKGDACEYAHGVFESWLHPAQYRTRLCKDEIGCTRKVCFFAHKPEELRPVYASTGSAMPSPRSAAVNAVDMATLSPLALGSSSLPLPSTSTPPMSPLAASSSPKAGGLWQNKINLTPPVLQLPGSRLKTAFSARDLDLEMELLGLENHASQLQQQQLMDEISSLSSPSCWSKEYSRLGDLKPTNLDDAFGSLDPSLLSPLKGLSVNSATPSQLQSPTGLQIRQNLHQLRASYPTNVSSSPVRKPSAFGFDSAAAVAAAVMNSRSSAFAKRSQSFVDRGALTTRAGLTAPANSATMMSSNISDWSSPDGKLDWGIQGDELNKLRKSASFGFRNNNPATTASIDMMPSNFDEPDVSWVNTLVKDVTPVGGGLQQRQQRYSGLGKGVRETLPPWVEQMYIEQEQMVA
ncbi:zinc finger protein [Theobroma cacao]|nr:zinc finger protein [Theobroma cacao]